eukprot:NODE_3745_length_924_cov_9.878857_g3444_i0.p1 GENE.NODE_3745_length_924_cov_9.878857_g3444_i0~~NODE_3745_length_924_cov_9.878857_g3444_i0.p1  ORF type:complete len:257 (+),score=35.73 NODE_3745_length_924_cov_9.878857_g3444_i0:81-773(+)
MPRRDGRRSSQFRNPLMNIGVASQARGSAYVEVGQTKVMCCVYGPNPFTGAFSETGRVCCHFSRALFANFEKRKPNYLQQQQTDEEKEYSRLMEQALESAVILDRFPKSQIDIRVMVLECCDCDDLAVAITCASLALADAGIELYDLVASCSACEVDGEMLLDPTNEELKHASSRLTVSYMNSLCEITHLAQYGQTSLEKIRLASDQCIDGCSKIRAGMEKCLMQKFQKA